MISFNVKVLPSVQATALHTYKIYWKAIMIPLD